MVFCDVHDLDDGPADVIDPVWIKSARKDHRCGECGETIEPGEPYERTGIVADGRAYTFKTCEFCVAGWNELEVLTGALRVFGGLAAAWREAFEEGESERRARANLVR